MNDISDTGSTRSSWIKGPLNGFLLVMPGAVPSIVMNVCLFACLFA